MVVMLVLKSDKQRYGSLIADIMNDYTRGLGGRSAKPTLFSEYKDGKPPHRRQTIDPESAL